MKTEKSQRQDGILRDIQSELWWWRTDATPRSVRDIYVFPQVFRDAISHMKDQRVVLFFVRTGDRAGYYRSLDRGNARFVMSASKWETESKDLLVTGIQKRTVFTHLGLCPSRRWTSFTPSPSSCPMCRVFSGKRWTGQYQNVVSSEDGQAGSERADSGFIRLFRWSIGDWSACFWSLRPMSLSESSNIRLMRWRLWICHSNSWSCLRGGNQSQLCHWWRRHRGGHQLVTDPSVFGVESANFRRGLFWFCKQVQDWSSCLKLWRKLVFQHIARRLLSDTLCQGVFQTFLTCRVTNVFSSVAPEMSYLVIVCCLVTWIFDTSTGLDILKLSPCCWTPLGFDIIWKKHDSQRLMLRCFMSVHVVWSQCSRYLSEQSLCFSDIWNTQTNLINAWRKGLS